MKLAPPATLVLETAAVCNLRCIHCAYGMGLTAPRSQAFIDIGLVNRVLEQVGQVQTCYPALWGEPTLHPNLLEILEAIRPHAKTIVLTTNGTLIDDRLAAELAQRVDRIAVGIPAATAKTYQAFCGVDRFEAAMRGLQLLDDEASQKTSWVFVVTNANEHEADVARALAAELDIALYFKSAYLPQGVKVGPSSTACMSRYISNSVPRVSPLTCRDFWDALQVLADGQITTCCYDFRNEVVVGDALTQHVIDDVWRGAAYQALRENHLAGRLASFCRDNCGRES